MEVCKRFLQKRCDQSKFRRECKFAHPEDRVEVIGNMVEPCKNFLRGRCRRDDCKYFHPPNHLVALAEIHIFNRSGRFSGNALSSGIPRHESRSFGVNPSQFGFMASDPASFVGQSTGNTATQIFHLLQTRQKIQTELQLAHDHVQAFQQRCQLLAEQERAIVENIYAIDPAGHVVQQFQNNPSFGGSMGGPRPVIEDAIEIMRSRKRENTTMTVCRDFLKDRCDRGESSCKYAHIPAHLKTAAHDDGRVTICIDFVHKFKKCERETCRYFHPPPHLVESFTQDNVHSIRSHKRRRRSSREENDAHLRERGFRQELE